MTIVWRGYSVLASCYFRVRIQSWLFFFCKRPLYLIAFFYFSVSLKPLFSSHLRSIIFRSLTDTALFPFVLVLLSHSFPPSLLGPVGFLSLDSCQACCQERNVEASREGLETTPLRFKPQEDSKKFVFASQQLHRHSISLFRFETCDCVR